MSARKFAFFGGVVMVGMGLLALVFAGNPFVLKPIDVNVSHGLFLGFFPMNLINKLALISIGAAGIYCARMPIASASINYCRGVCVGMGALALLGMPRATDTLFGLAPLYGGNVLVSLAFALLAGYAGFARSEERDTVFEREDLVDNGVASRRQDRYDEHPPMHH